MGAQRYTVGEIEVWCLQDGASSFDNDVFPSITDQDRADRLAAAGQSQIDTAFNAYLIKHPDGALDLVDTGCAHLFGPGAGFLPSRLKALGIAPGDIRNIFMTHLHRDHAGGLLSDGQAAYPNARLFVHPNELAAFAENPDVARLPDVYPVTEIADGDVLPGGLRVWELFGHTPGHVGFWIGDRLALVGDILHSYALQLPQIEACPKNDMNPDEAIATRHAALSLLAEQGIVWSGSHAVESKFMRVFVDGDGFRVEPA